MIHRKLVPQAARIRLQNLPRSRTADRWPHRRGTDAAALSMAESSRIGDLVPTWWWLESRRDIEVEDARHPVDGAPLRSHRVVNTPIWVAH